MKTKFPQLLIVLAFIASGCDKGPASPPANEQLAPNQQPVAQAPATQAPAANTATMPQATQPAEAFDIVSLMNRIPTNEFVLSDSGGWDKFTMPKVQKWVDENLVGKKVRTDVCMIRCNVYQEDANSKPNEWTVSLQTAGLHADYAGMPNRILPFDKRDQTDHGPDQVNGTFGKASFAFKCNEAEARKWDAFSKRLVPAVTVVGDVVGINLQPHAGNIMQTSVIGYDTFVQLDNIALKPLTNTEPGMLNVCELQMANDGSLREPEQAITEINRLADTGGFQLVFVRYDDWGESINQKQIKTKLLSFGPNDKEITVTPCSDPPAATEIADAKAKVGWPTSNQ